MNSATVNKLAGYLGESCDLKWNVDKGIYLCKDNRELRSLGGVLSVLGSRDGEDAALTESVMYQWGESAQLWWRAVREGGTKAALILKEINNYLEGCSYFVGYTRSLADVLMYHLLYDVLESLSVSERRQYPCVCRWFNHIQQDSKLRQNNPLLNFSASFILPSPTTPTVGY